MSFPCGGALWQTNRSHFKDPLFRPRLGALMVPSGRELITLQFFLFSSPPKRVPSTISSHVEYPLSLQNDALSYMFAGSGSFIHTELCISHDHTDREALNEDPNLHSYPRLIHLKDFFERVCGLRGRFSGGRMILYVPDSMNHLLWSLSNKTIK